MLRQCQGHGRTRRWRLASAAVLAIGLTGCGTEPELPLVPVSGTVTYQGEPLSHGAVVFMPESGTTGPQAVGHIQADGTFQMQTAGQSGAVVGKHRVAVHCRQQPKPAEQRSMGPAPKSLIPEKYSNPETSSLQIDVPKGGDNDADIALQ